MIEAMWILIFGIVIFALGYMGKAGKYKTLALVAGGLMVLGGAFYPGYGLWEDTFEFALPEEGVTGGATFILDATNGSLNVAGEPNIVGVAADDGQSITFQLNSDGTHTLDEVYGGVNVSIVPTPPAGSTGTDYATMKIEIDGDAMVGTNIEVWAQVSNEPNLDWYAPSGQAVADRDYIIISDQYSNFDWVELRYALDSGAADTFADVYDEVGEEYNIPVTFTCGDWSDTINLRFFVITDA